MRRHCGAARTSRRPRKYAADGQQVVAQRVELAARRRLSAEPGLRQQPPDDDDARVGQGEPVGPVVERDPSRAPQRRCQRGDEQHVLPRGDDVERGAADACVPGERHDEVVRGQPDREREQRDPREAGASCDRDERQSEVDDAHRARERARAARTGRAGGSPSPTGAGRGRRRGARRARAASARAAAACGARRGTSGSGVVMNTRPPTRSASETKARWRSAAPTCSTTAFEKTTSKASSGKGSAHASPWTYAMCG